MNAPSSTPAQDAQAAKDPARLTTGWGPRPSVEVFKREEGQSSPDLVHCETGDILENRAPRELMTTGAFRLVMTVNDANHAVIQWIDEHGKIIIEEEITADFVGREGRDLTVPAGVVTGVRARVIEFGRLRQIWG